MFLPPIGYFQAGDWESENKDHPQSRILKSHIERAVQDLFLDSLRSQHEDFLFIFDDKDQIEKFSQKMIRYWEKEEEYEICSEIIKLKKKMISRWKKLIEKNSIGGEEMEEWLRSSI